MALVKMLMVNLVALEVAEVIKEVVALELLDKETLVHLDKAVEHLSMVEVAEVKTLVVLVVQQEVVHQMIIALTLMLLILLADKVEQKMEIMVQLVLVMEAVAEATVAAVRPGRY